MTLPWAGSHDLPQYSSELPGAGFSSYILQRYSEGIHYYPGHHIVRIGHVFQQHQYMSVRQGKSHRGARCSPRSMEGGYGGQMGMTCGPADLEGGEVGIQGTVYQVRLKFAAF